MCPNFLLVLYMVMGIRFSPTLLYFPLHPGWRWAESQPMRCQARPEEDLGMQNWPAALEPCTGLRPPPAGRSLPGQVLQTAERACTHRGLSHSPGCWTRALKKYLTLVLQRWNQRPTDLSSHGHIIYSNSLQYTKVWTVCFKRHHYNKKQI